MEPPGSKIKNYKMVTAEHYTKCRAFCHVTQVTCPRLWNLDGVGVMKAKEAVIIIQHRQACRSNIRWHLALERVPWADPSSTVQLKFKTTLWKTSRTILIQFTNEEKALRAASLPKYFWHPWLFSGTGQTTCPLICYKIKLPLSFSIPLPSPVKNQEKPTAARGKWT